MNVKIHTNLERSGRREYLSRCWPLRIQQKKKEKEGEEESRSGGGEEKGRRKSVWYEVTCYKICACDEQDKRAGWETGA